MPNTRSLALGIMSGTSADGVSLALIESGARLRVLADATYPYHPEFRARLLRAPNLSVRLLSELDFDLGRLFSQAALRFLKKCRVAPGRLRAAGSHGHTAVHRPSGANPSTLQIGEASFLSESLGVPIVCDFRPRDMAAGGEGAPIVPAFDEALFGNGPAAVLQNIGGIANAAVVGKGVAAVAFDNGPGNCLIDLAVMRMTRGKATFDRGGKIALSGIIDQGRVAALLKDSFFKKSPPKSLDRSKFSQEYLRRYFPSGKMRHQDTVATLTYLTAKAIVDSYRVHLAGFRPRRVIVSGGGALNAALMTHLRLMLSPLPVTEIDAYGIPAMAKEPAAIAWMALRALSGRANHCPEASGAKGVRILGKIIPASPSRFR